ncbi:Protein of unknown function DUF262 [Pseudomonas linyingensis]|uniref:GmrSD restriction endonucleases N-terminal domain-containing protein n=1 Tax=Pseudomonas linyingensis TaxID=915471 RepID=A0A1H6XVS0_9PSED|nr:DUF262 domain-containing protein [Pseudomonas linyingensis]SEJ33131.1 Protein of unknown function DUF262 [Pseudomonas linyingensis]
MSSIALEDEIAAAVGEVRTDSFDMTFGEIANLHANKELVIQPEYQRLFRWSVQQKSHLIESILLELPVPQIFVIENPDGVLELIDGLQRVSTILQFIEPSSIGLDQLVLDGCSLIRGLNNLAFPDLPLSLRLRLKRSPIRVVVIKKQSKGFLRYEMFKRLNTGGSNLEPQEIRNCSARMVGEAGINFYNFLVRLSGSVDFAACAEFLSQPDKEKKAAEELVLRFFAVKNYIGEFKGSVRDWLDNYMEGILLEDLPFDYAKEEADFIQTLALIRNKLGDAAFLRHRGDTPVGSLPPAYFEAIAMAFYSEFDKVKNKTPSALRKAVSELIQGEEFRSVTGPGANSRDKMRARINLTTQAILDA